MTWIKRFRDLSAKLEIEKTDAANIALYEKSDYLKLAAYASVY